MMKKCTFLISLDCVGPERAVGRPPAGLCPTEVLFFWGGHSFHLWLLAAAPCSNPNNCCHCYGNCNVFIHLTDELNGKNIWICCEKVIYIQRKKHFTFMGPCIVCVFKQNQQDATLCNGIYYCISRPIRCTFFPRKMWPKFDLRLMRRG